MRGEMVRAPAGESQRKPTTDAELERCEGGPLPVYRLAAIWRGLPEDERLGFLHALDEGIADEVLAHCVKRAPAAPKE